MITHPTGEINILGCRPCLARSMSLVLDPFSPGRPCTSAWGSPASLLKSVLSSLASPLLFSTSWFFLWLWYWRKITYGILGSRHWDPLKSLPFGQSPAPACFSLVRLQSPQLLLSVVCSSLLWESVNSWE